MNESRLSLIAAALLLAFPASCTKNHGNLSPPLQGARIGGPFDLTNQDGKEVRDSDFNGHYRLIYFGYTFCPDACPTALQKLSAGLRAFAKIDPARAAKVQPIFITVDPARDTPPVLKQYVEAFPPRLIGLTGSPAEIAKVAKEFAVSYRIEKTAGASGYLVNHTSLPILFGPDGQPITPVPVDKGADEVAVTLDQWVK